ncbi:MAG: response regulator [Acidobacteriota bacterium]|jgi:CheY-like chemotaxis protein
MTRHTDTDIYPVTCPSCGQAYDACHEAFCSCIVSVRTPVCPHCGSCLCSRPREEQRRFWSEAPPALWRRRLASRKFADTEGVPQSLNNLSRPLILVAEDEIDSLKIAGRLLIRAGYGVLLTDNGQEALDLARRFLPDLVLADAMMPKMDGRRLSLTLKSRDATRHIKVAVMTGLFTKQSHKTQALSHYQADAYLAKPVNPLELQNVVKKLVGAPIPLRL